MYISIADQTIVFLKAILFGAAIGGYYDVLRAVRREGRLRGFLVALLDGIFWLAVIVAFALFVLLAADGTGRSYVLIGLAGGLMLYFLTLSPVVLRLLAIVLSTVLFLLGWLLRIAAIPARLLCRLSSVPLVKKIIHKFPAKNFKKTLPFFREKV